MEEFPWWKMVAALLASVVLVGGWQFAPQSLFVGLWLAVLPPAVVFAVWRTKAERPFPLSSRRGIPPGLALRQPGEGWWEQEAVRTHWSILLTQEKEGLKVSLFVPLGVFDFDRYAFAYSLITPKGSEGVPNRLGRIIDPFKEWDLPGVSIDCWAPAALVEDFVPGFDICQYPGVWGAEMRISIVGQLAASIRREFNVTEKGIEGGGLAFY